ncbi:putative ribonuclease H-like domain-containing protein [Tanacetum coccineum]
MGTVRFGNDNFAVITGYGDYISGNITICHVYYVEGLGHNLFSVGQFCDGDLEVASDYKTLEVLHMDLCCPMRVASVNGKKYILIIVDDFSRFMWVYFLCSKDETPKIIKKYKAKVCKIRTDNGTEFKNATLKAYYEKLGIMQQFSIALTP